MSSTAIFLSQQSRQYFSSPRGSETSFALQSAHRTCATDLRDMGVIVSIPDVQLPIPKRRNNRGSVLLGSWALGVGIWELGFGTCQRAAPARPRKAGAYMVSTYSFTMRRALKRGETLMMACRTTCSQRRGTPLSRS